MYFLFAEGPKTPPLPAGVKTKGGADDGEIMEQLTGEDDVHKPSDDVELNLSSVSDTSLASCSGDEGMGPKTPPTAPNKSFLTNVSDVSSDLDVEQPQTSSQEDAPGNQAEKMGGGGAQPEERETSTTGASTNQLESGGDTPGNQPVATATEETAAASEDLQKSADSTELSGVSSSDVASSERDSVLPGEDVPHPLSIETTSLQDSAPSSPTAMGTPTKTPGKRKASEKNV